MLVILHKTKPRVESQVSFVINVVVGDVRNLTHDQAHSWMPSGFVSLLSVKLLLVMNFEFCYRCCCKCGSLLSSSWSCLWCLNKKANLINQKIVNSAFNQCRLNELIGIFFQECGKHCFMTINFIPHTFQHRLLDFSESSSVALLGLSNRQVINETIKKFRIHNFSFLSFIFFH